MRLTNDCMTVPYKPLNRPLNIDQVRDQWFQPLMVGHVTNTLVWTALGFFAVGLFAVGQFAVKKKPNLT